MSDQTQKPNAEPRVLTQREQYAKNRLSMYVNEMRMQPDRAADLVMRTLSVGIGPDGEPLELAADDPRRRTNFDPGVAQASNALLLGVLKSNMIIGIGE